VLFRSLKPESRVELGKLVALLNKNPGLKIEISGHSDNVGTPAYNIELSNNRAEAVYDYLVARGIDKSRLTYAGYGLTRPIDTNETEQGRANNRRTEFRITAK
jgi:outer membrane protein OmpA-like peptidoglycan-associated protein